MKLKPFQTYSIDSESHTFGYTIALPINSESTATRGGMTGKMLIFLGWLFYPTQAGGQAHDHSKFGAQTLEYEYLEDIEKYNWDVEERTDNLQKQRMIKEVFEYYESK